jgi:hypothetical protein
VRCTSSSGGWLNAIVQVMGAWKILGTGLVLLLAVGLTGCTQADPVQVSTISATVKKLDLKSLGGVVCDGVYEPHGVGSTVTYERTIGVRGAGQEPELAARLERAGFKLSVEETKNSRDRTYLYGPHQTSATLLSHVHKSPGEKIYIDDQHKCGVPKAGLTMLILEPTGG